jgi:hypothetical protein
MPKLKKKKKADRMTDEELLHDIFPKKIIREMKKIALKARKKSKLKFHHAGIIA